MPVFRHHCIVLILVHLGLVWAGKCQDDRRLYAALLTARGVMLFVISVIGRPPQLIANICSQYHGKLVASTGILARTIAPCQMSTCSSSTISSQGPATSSARLNTEHSASAKCKFRQHIWQNVHGCHRHEVPGRFGIAQGATHRCKLRSLGASSCEKHLEAYVGAYTKTLKALGCDCNLL